MARTTNWIAAAVLGLLSIPSAYADIHHMRFDIPFQFVAGEKVLPAGQYEVRIDPACGRLEVRAADGSTGAYVTARPSYRPAAVDNGTLLFVQYGNAHFLRRVAAAGRWNGYETGRSKAEREMAKASGTPEVAWVQAGSR